MFIFTFANIDVNWMKNMEKIIQSTKLKIKHSYQKYGGVYTLEYMAFVYINVIDLANSDSVLLNN